MRRRPAGRSGAPGGVRGILCAALFGALLMPAGLACADEEGFESPAAVPVATLLPPEQRSGADFEVEDPVASDGLMRHYRITSRFGTFEAYGQLELARREREIAALAVLASRSHAAVVRETVARNVKSQADTIDTVLTHPVDTIAGIPRGIEHLFSGVRAQAQEVRENVHEAAAGGLGSGGLGPGGAGGGGLAADRALATARSGVASYAERYTGLSAAERRYYQELGIDPYTDNAVLRRAVHRLARVEAATNLGMHFARIPGVPHLGDVHRALEAIYHEDPAVLRARRRAFLTELGLAPVEIERYEHQPLWSPTCQAVLEEHARSLAGVEDRAELFRRALSMTSTLEVEVYLQSTRLLVELQSQMPLQRILPGPYLPAAALRAGGTAVVGAFDAVYWTSAVASYESSLYAAVGGDEEPLELWIGGPVSPAARAGLEERGWHVHAEAARLLEPTPGSSSAAL